MAHLLLILSALAGAIHTVAPDHWMPLSLASWQQRWKAGVTLSLSLGALLVHLAAGFMLFIAFHSFLGTLDHEKLFIFSVALVVVSAGFRAFRFQRIRDSLRMGSNRFWGLLTVLSLLGPCESLIPVMIKAHHLGVGYLSTFLAFSSGTLASGLVLIVAGRFLWNHPLRLIQGVSWANQRRSVLPIVLGVTVGLIFILKL